ncbi:LysR family transcriptional regulator [Sphingopyxis kveilinensis]|uniref:LysR family transcriptional regulator n=1 Tax=Sphingopyxis kveilinensis TaxID=3114367 RepID=UPI0030D29B4E
MTPKLLRTFLAVERTGNISIAAAQLNLAQSTVSDQIQSFEVQIGTALFERTRGGIRLAPAGQTLKPYAEAILAMTDEAVAALAHDHRPRSGTLAIGALETIAAQWLPERLSGFRKAHSDIGLRLQAANSGDLMRLVKDGGLDAILCFEARDLDPKLVGRVVAHEPLALISKADGQPDRAPGFVTTRSGCIFRRIFDENIAAFESSGGRIIAEVDSIAAIVNLVAQGDGAALVPEMAAAEALRNGQVRRLGNAAASKHVRLSLVWRRRRVQPPALRYLLKSFPSHQSVSTVTM